MGMVIFGIAALICGLLGRAAWIGGDVIDCLVSIGLWCACVWCLYAFVGQVIIAYIA